MSDTTPSASLRVITLNLWGQQGNWIPTSRCSSTVCASSTRTGLHFRKRSRRKPMIKLWICWVPVTMASVTQTHYLRCKWHPAQVHAFETLRGFLATSPGC